METQGGNGKRNSFLSSKLDGFDVSNYLATYLLALVCCFAPAGVWSGTCPLCVLLNSYCAVDRNLCFSSVHGDMVVKLNKSGLVVNGDRIVAQILTGTEEDKFLQNSSAKRQQNRAKRDNDWSDY